MALDTIITLIQDYVLSHYVQWSIILIIIIFGFLGIKIVDRYLTRFFDRVNLDRTLELLIQKTINVFLWIVLAIIILSNIGFDVTGFIAGLGVMGFVIGFAVKDVLSNLAAGMFLLVKRPFKVGEEVEVVKIKGKVKLMTLSSCVIITKENEYVTVPNAKIWGNPIKNLSRLKKK